MLLSSIILSSGLFVSGCREGKKEFHRYSAEFLQYFDTASRIIGYGESEEDFKKEAEFIYERLAFYHRRYDFFETYPGINNIKTINDNAGIAPVVVDQSIIDLIDFSLTGYELTEGRVNIAMGSVLSLWHRQRNLYQSDPSQVELPSKDMLSEAAAHTDISKILINREKNTVYLSDPDMKLDVGSVAKGYAVERVVREAREAGIYHVILSVGGNVSVIGSKPGKEAWSVGVHQPGEGEEVSIPPVYMTSGSLVSSGDYERFLVADNIVYGHIIDPETNRPVKQGESYRQVSILAQDAGLADIYSTAVFLMDLEEGKRFVKDHGVEALWILNDGSVESSSGFWEANR